MNIYVLQLQNNKYYIGKTKNVNKRLEQHFNKNIYGSAWTSKHKPIKLIETIKNIDDFDEDKYTLKYMKKYGIDNVRGGSFSQLILSNETVSHINKMIESTNDNCYRCGRNSHYITNCYAKTHISGKLLNDECEDVEEIKNDSKQLSTKIYINPFTYLKKMLKVDANAIYGLKNIVK